jgi:hypothetical protein
MARSLVSFLDPLLSWVKQRLLSCAEGLDLQRAVAEIPAAAGERPHDPSLSPISICFCSYAVDGERFDVRPRDKRLHLDMDEILWVSRLAVAALSTRN